MKKIFLFISVFSIITAIFGYLVGASDYDFMLQLEKIAAIEFVQPLESFNDLIDHLLNFTSVFQDSSNPLVAILRILIYCRNLMDLLVEVLKSSALTIYYLSKALFIFFGLV